MLLIERMFCAVSVFSDVWTAVLAISEHSSSEWAGMWVPARSVSHHDDLSHFSVRVGQPVFSFTYFSASASSIGRTLSFMGWIQSEIFTHLVPSHCCM